MLDRPVLAVTAQQSFGIVVALLVTVGWILYLVANVKKAKPEIGSEIELAANRKPYLDDEGLEGPRLDRVLTWGLISLTLIGLGLPLYWLAEPGRQAGAVNDFDEVFASRGEGLFAATADGGFNCAGCHGGLAGVGGEVAYTLTDPDTGQLRQVNWYAPSLNDVTLRIRPPLTSRTWIAHAWCPSPSSAGRYWAYAGQPLAPEVATIREPRQPAPGPSIHAPTFSAPRSHIANGGMFCVASACSSATNASMS